MMREPYTHDQLNFLREYGADVPTAELAAMLNNKFGANHTLPSVRTTVKKLGIRKSKKCRSETCAKRGQPIGSTKIIQGYRYVKVGISNGGFYSDWKREILISYDKAYGKVPNGYMVITLDGNKLNANPDNLVAIPKSIAARMANGHGKSMWSEFPEVTKTAIEVCKLDDAIAEAEKARKDNNG